MSKINIGQKKGMIFLEDLAKTVTPVNKMFYLLLIIIIPYRLLMKIIAPRSYKDSLGTAVVLFSSGSSGISGTVVSGSPNSGSSSSSSSGGGSSGGGGSSTKSLHTKSNMFGGSNVKTNFNGEGSYSVGSGRGQAYDSLTKAKDLSVNAQGLDVRGSKAGASSAFGAGSFGDSDLTTGFEQEVAKNAAGLGQLDKDTIRKLKAGKDMNAKNITIPEIDEVGEDDVEIDEDDLQEQIIMLIAQAAISGIMGPMFGAIGGAIFGGAV
jgi:hypothetical protein